GSRPDAPWSCDERPGPLPARRLPPLRPGPGSAGHGGFAGAGERVHRRGRGAGGALWHAGAGAARRGPRTRAGLAVRRGPPARVAGGLKAPVGVARRAGGHSGWNTTRVLTFTALGISLVSAQSPPPTPKSRRCTTARPFSTGWAPEASQLKVRVTGLLTPRSSRVPSAAYWPSGSLRKPEAV